MKNDDGLYVQIFVIKDGVKYNVECMTLKEMALILSNSLMDGFAKICGEDSV